MKEINLAKKDLLILSILIFLFSFLAGAFTATEYMAYRFQFSPLLGKSFWHLYNPLDCWFWLKMYLPIYPAARSMMLNSMIYGSLVFFFMPLILTFIVRKFSAKIKKSNQEEE